MPPEGVAVRAAPVARPVAAKAVRPGRRRMGAGPSEGARARRTDVEQDRETLETKEAGALRPEQDVVGGRLEEGVPEVFLGDRLGRDDIARSIVLSEILGPPKGFQ